MKKVKEYLEKSNPERVSGFMKGASEFVKFVLSKFDEFTFYTPESYDTENSIILSYYKNEEDETPHFLILVDGLKGIKY